MFYLFICLKFQELHGPEDSAISDEKFTLGFF